MFVSLLGESIPCPMMRVSSCGKFSACSKLPLDKTIDRDVCLIYGDSVAYTLHKPITRASSIRGDEFCHWITKF